MIGLKLNFTICVMISGFIFISEPIFAQSNSGVYFSGGMSIALDSDGNFKDFNTGPNLSIGEIFPLNDLISVNYSIEYSYLLKNWGDAVYYVSSNEFGRISLLSGIINLKAVSLPEKKSTPYIIGGIGITRMNKSVNYNDPIVVFGDYPYNSMNEGPSPTKFSPETSLILNMGVGIEIKLTKNTRIFAEGRYFNIFGSERLTIISPLRIGLSFW